MYIKKDEITNMKRVMVENVNAGQALALLDIYGTAATHFLREVERIDAAAVQAANAKATAFHKGAAIKPALLEYCDGKIRRVSHSGCTEITIYPRPDGKYNVNFRLFFWPAGTPNNPVGSSLYWDGIDRLIREALAEA